MLGAAIWALFTSVRFAVVQITALVIAALIGMTIHQLPAFAVGPNATAADYASEMAKLHAQYDPSLGRAVADLFERLGFFRVFSTPWFAALLGLLFLSILVCTIDRIPRLWRDVRSVHVAQPDAYFDPRLPGRVVFERMAPLPGEGATGSPAGTAGAESGASDGSAAAERPGAETWPVDGIRAVLRRRHFRVRSVTSGSETYLYGDRNQYTKLATLITHLGLLTFILAAVVTAYGVPFLNLYPAEVPVVLAQDQTQTIEPIGTPDLLIVKNLGFSAPLDAEGKPLDFTTDLAVYQNGVQVARKTIRVNDPLSYDGYTFHQNFTGPAVNLELRDSAGNPLWTGPVPLSDAPVDGHPDRHMVVPGRNIALDLLLFQDPTAGDVLVVTADRQTGTAPNGQPILQRVAATPLRVGDGYTSAADNYSLRFAAVSSYTGLIARRDPGEWLVWYAFGLLIAGLLITFYLPRRRVWMRVGRDGSLAVVGRSDRYVPFEREFGELLGALAEVRPGARGVEGGGARVGATGGAVPSE